MQWIICESPAFVTSAPVKQNMEATLWSKFVDVERLGKDDSPHTVASLDHGFNTLHVSRLRFGGIHEVLPQLDVMGVSENNRRDDRVALFESSTRELTDLRAIVRCPRQDRSKDPSMLEDTMPLTEFVEGMRTFLDYCTSVVSGGN